MTTILVTGGAGFAGSSLALLFKRDRADVRVVGLDNLRRRGSELIRERLARGGVEFVHGDVRQPADIEAVGPFDLLIECSAEASVRAGFGTSPAYVIDTNLGGAIHCFEAARRHGADVVFVSSSRVYSIAALRGLPLVDRGDRFVVPDGAAGPGWSARGITTDFSLAGPRSLYEGTKLAAEVIAEEYCAAYGLRVVVDRCGLLTGPWQMGKIDQGVVALWASRHLFGGTLTYTGFGGCGHQVRDVLHVEDFYDLLVRQLAAIERHVGRVYNVGGGPERSVSLAELTEHCVRRSGRRLAIARSAETHPTDVPHYVSDVRPVAEATGWSPRWSVDAILDAVWDWLCAHRSALGPILG